MIGPRAITQSQQQALMWLCALFVFLNLSNPNSAIAETEQQQLTMDCGSLWVDGADARVRATITPDVYNSNGAEARIVLQDGIFGNTNKPLRSSTVFQCIPDVGNGTLKAVSSVWQRNSNGKNEIYFSLPPESQPFDQFRYHIYLSQSEVWEEQRSLLTDGRQAKRPNLIINSDFSFINPADPLNPEGWYLDGERSQGTFRTSTELLQHSNLSHENAVRLQVVGPSNSRIEAPAPRVSLADNISVQPLSELKVTARAWIRSATGTGLRVQGRFKDEQGNSVGKPFILDSPAGLKTEAYQDFTIWTKVPVKATNLQLRVSMMNNVGVTDLLSLRIEESHLDSYPFATILTQRLEEGARVTKPLKPTEGGESMLFDLGPENSKIAAGFALLGPTAEWKEGQDAGWPSGTTLSSFKGELPEGLTADGIRLGETPLKLRTSSGAKWIWILMGSSGEHSHGPVTGDNLVINGETVEVPSIPYTPLSYHLEREDDAILELRTQNKSIFNTYMLPRFTQYLSRIENPEGVIEVSCAPGKTCPIVALGVFSDMSEEAMNQAILRIQKRRRVTFDDRWANAGPIPNLALNIDVSEDEKERGFLPFLPAPGIPISPNTKPNRESVRKAMNGIHVSVAPGSRALFRVGIYPLKFRRQGRLSLSEPISQVGDKIEGADWKIRTTRYRALRPEGLKGNYTLEADLAEESKVIGIRPRITRTIWIDAEIPESAQAGDYLGALRIQAGKNRFIELPIRIHVLPFPLPLPGHGHGTSFQENMNPDYRIMRYVNAVSLDLNMKVPSQLIPKMERTITQLKETGNFAKTIFLVPNRQFTKEAIPDWLSMLTVLAETAKSRDWPKIIPVSSAFQESGFSRKQLRTLCTSMGWKCAAVTKSYRPRKRDKTEAIKWLTKSAYWETVSVEENNSNNDVIEGSWLYNLGCGRVGKGLMSWAYNLKGTLCLSGNNALPDSLDAWSALVDSHPLDHLTYEGRILETERFLLSQQGLLDARYLALMEQLLRRGKKVLPKEQLTDMREFLKRTRAAVIDSKISDWRFGVSQHWPVSNEFRDDMIIMLEKAWNSLQP